MKAKAADTKRNERTSWLLAESLSDGSLLLKVDVPAIGLTSLVLQGESKDGVGSLKGTLAGGIIGLESLIDGIESLGGWERSCNGSQWLALECSRRVSSAQTCNTMGSANDLRKHDKHIPFLRDMMGTEANKQIE